MQATKSKSTSIINRIAGSIAAVVAILLPLGYFALSYQYKIATLATSAEINAYIVTQLINRNPELWSFEEGRLLELISRKNGKTSAEAKRILDNNNNIIVESHDKPSMPVVTRSDELMDSGKVVGRMEVSGSLQPLLANTALVALLGLTLGSGVFIALRALSLRAEETLRQSETHLKQLNKELEDAYNELKIAHAHLLQQEKMASIGQLAAGVAHEINNPTGFIMSNLGSLQKYTSRMSEFIKKQAEAIEELSDVIARSISDEAISKDKIATPEPALSDKTRFFADTQNDKSEEVRNDILNRVNEFKKSLKIDYITDDSGSLIKESLDGAERIKRIVQNLKSFSRFDESEWKMADINTGLESTINIVWNELKYKAEIKKKYGDIPVTKCNPGQLNQVFMNMLINAAQAIEKQGEITVRTWHKNGHINISISDTGCGIPEDKLSRIFEPFYTTKEVGKGTGLGLSIAYDIVKKHNGEITVKSEAGKGTTFTVKIPIMNNR